MFQSFPAVSIDGGCVATTPFITGNSACAPNNCFAAAATGLYRRHLRQRHRNVALRRNLEKPLIEWGVDLCAARIATSSTVYDAYSVSYSLPGTYS
jgi:hypothetical protein